MKIFLEKYNIFYDMNFEVGHMMSPEDTKSAFQEVYVYHLGISLLRKNINLNHDIYHVSPEQHFSLLDGLIYLEQLENYFKNDVFCKSYQEGLKKGYTMELYVKSFVQKVEEKINEFKILEEEEKIINEINVDNKKIKFVKKI